MPSYFPNFSKLAPFCFPALLLPALTVGGGLALSADGSDPSRQAAYDKDLKPLFAQYCLPCHGAGKASGGVNLAKYATLTDLQNDPMTWKRVTAQLKARSMPPQGLPQPSADQHDKMIRVIDDALNHISPALLPKNPGRVLIHRLSRQEYNNTVRDLFGVKIRPADSFPPDGGGGGGFDNNADTLFVPPILMERYLEAANAVLDAASPQRNFFVKPGKAVAPRAAARQILQRYATLGWRRPAEPAEVDRLLTLYDASVARKETHESAVKFALKGILVSPNFLFRIEGDRPKPGAYPVSDYELASRLSYFLWASMPDAALFDLAARKQLHDPNILEAQVRRMLLDPKADALAEGFAGQWLRIRDLYTARQPDPGKFPDYKPPIRNAMINETFDFFTSIFHDDASVLKLLDADYTYLNEDLAKLYGIDGVKGKELRRVKLTGHKRGGVLTMASVLTLTSFPQRTSPVLRGKWVMENILGAPVPPPPPGAGGLSTNDAPEEGLTFRQRLEKHRSKPECASCHSRMDPLGFGLENFDAIGRWREKVGDTAVDSSGVLTTGEKFSGPEQLKGLLLKQKGEFVRNLTEKMLSYALGRGLEPYDQPTVKKIADDVAKDGYRSTTLVKEVVMSYPFLYRRT